MIDGVNLYIPCALSSDFPGHEAGKKFQYRVRNMQVTVSPVAEEHVKVSVRGSLHKFFNGGEHNANDFTPGMAREAARGLVEALGVNPEAVNVGGFEFGVNIPLPFDSDRFINGIIALRAGERVPIKTPTIKNALGVVFEYGDYDVKIYNKSKESPAPYSDHNILRVEIKVKRRKIIKNARVESFGDLVERGTWRVLSGWLRGIVPGLVFYEHGTVDSSGFSPTREKLFRDGTTINYWDLCRMDNSRQTYRNRLNSFERLINTCTSSTMKADVNALFQMKIDEIMALLADEETRPENDRVEVPRAGVAGGRDEVVVMFPGSFAGKVLPSLVCSRGEGKTCPVTGLNISMQRSDSRFLSVTGIRYYMARYPVIGALLRGVLSSRWQGAPVDKQVEEIAHFVRNRYHNSRRQPPPRART